MTALEVLDLLEASIEGMIEQSTANLRAGRTSEAVAIGEQLGLNLVLREIEDIKTNIETIEKLDGPDDLP